MRTKELTIIADRGYFNGPEILDCARTTGMTPLVPKPLTSGSIADGRFDKRDFVYIAKDVEREDCAPQLDSGSPSLHPPRRSEPGEVVGASGFQASSCT